MPPELRRFSPQPENNKEIEPHLRTAIIYAGQGQDLEKLCSRSIELRRHPAALLVFDQCDEILAREFPDRFNEGLSPIIRQGSEDSIRQNQQLIVLLYNLACTSVLKQQEEENDFRFPPNSSIVAVSGQSLGLISAIVESGAIDVPNMLRLGVSRQDAMQEANKQNPGTLVALTADASDERVKKLMRAYGLEISIITGSSLVVLGGQIQAVEKAVIEVRNMRGEKDQRLRVLPLKTDGAFHTSLMKPAAEQLKQALRSIKIGDAEFPVIANTTGNEIHTPERIKKEIEDQLTRPVLWLRSTKTMTNKVDQFVEIGNDGLLTGHIKREIENSTGENDSLAKRLLHASGITINAIGAILTIRPPQTNPY